MAPASTDADLLLIRRLLDRPLKGTVALLLLAGDLLAVAASCWSCSALLQSHRVLAFAIVLRFGLGPPGPTTSGLKSLRTGRTGRCGGSGHPTRPAGTTTASPARLQFGASHLLEPHLCVERVGARVRRVEIDLADDAVVPCGPRVLDQVAVETGRDPLPATALGDDDPVDIDEAPPVRLEPLEVDTAVLRVLVQGDQQGGRSGCTGRRERARDERAPVLLRQE